MKTIQPLKAAAIILMTTLLISCASRFKGSASDTTGTNGATNGTGKVYTP